MEEEVLSKLIQAIEKINDDKRVLKDSLNTYLIDIENIKRDNKHNNNFIDKSIKIIDNKIDTQIKNIQDSINSINFNAKEILKENIDLIDIKAFYQDEVASFLDSIPKPKDGKNGKDAIVNYDDLYKKITDTISIIDVTPESVDYERIFKYIDAHIKKQPIPKDGKDGENGKDGTGIFDIIETTDDIKFVLTNGKSKVINKIHSKVNIGGIGVSSSSIQKIIKPTWTDYITRGEYVSTNVNVVTYIFDGVTIYRNVPSPYLHSNDAFYSDVELTNLLARRT